MNGAEREGPGPLAVVLPDSWGPRQAGRPGAASLRIEAGAGRAVLSRDGREIRFGVADGDVLDLLQAALAIHAGIPARAWPGADGPPGAVGAGEVTLHGRLRPGDALAAILGSGLRHVLANTRGAASGHVEAVHQQRVALRRLRTALTLFGPLLRPEPEGSLREELGRLGRTLGAARDWDVFCLDILPGLPDGVTHETARQALQDAAGERRRAAHDEVAQELGPAGVADLAGRIAGWTAAELAFAGTPLMEGRLEDVAPDLLGRLERKVRHRGRHIARRSEDELHALRKAAKKLRYAAAFLRPLFKTRRVKAYLDACEALQECLGHLNDLSNAARLARELGAGPAEAAEAVARRLDTSRDAAAQAAREGWHAFAKAEPFWA